MKWGIIGTGEIARKFADTINAMHNEGQSLLAVASRSPETASAFALSMKIPHAYAPYEAMLENTQVNAVYIATPNMLHFENAKAALLAGKHVLCEKPFTINGKQARALYTLAREKGLFIMEAFWIRFLPMLRKLRELLEAGEIGTVMHVRSEFGFIPPDSLCARKQDVALAAGALMDIGVYNLGFVYIVMPERPTGFHSTVAHNEYGTDCYSAIMLTYPNGKSASIVTAIGMDLPREAAIFGTAGVITFTNYHMAESMTVRPYGREAYTLNMPVEINGYEYEVREVERCVQLGLYTSDVLREQDSLAVLDTMDALRATWGITFPGEAEA